MVVLLSGSTKIKSDFIDIGQKLELSGISCMMPTVFSQADYIALTDQEIDILRRVYQNKIDKCDVMVVLVKDNYIGPSTIDEINYCYSKGTKVIIYNLNRSINELKELLTIKQPGLK